LTLRNQYLALTEPGVMIFERNIFSGFRHLYFSAHLYSPIDLEINYLTTHSRRDAVPARPYLSALGVNCFHSGSGWFHFGTCHILLKRGRVKIYGDPHLAKINNQHRPALM